MTAVWFNGEPVDGVESVDLRRPPPEVIAIGARIVAVMLGQPIERFTGCSFPSCSCTGRCVVIDTFA